MITTNIVGTSSVMVKRSTIVDVGGFDNKLSSATDLDCWLKIAKKGLEKRSIKNNQGQDETIFLRSVESVLNNNKSKAASTIEKFKVQKNLKFLYEKI